MKKLLFIIFLISAMISSCKKNSNKEFSHRRIGYIYNKNDSTPFVNTKFKVYYHRPSNGLNKEILKEVYFYTNANGFFDITTSINSGKLVWPSFYDGAAYTGPPYFGNSKRWETDEANKIYISYFDTLYTTPYH